MQRTRRKTIERVWAPVRLRLLRALGVEPPAARPGTMLPKVGKGADPAKLRFVNVPEAQEVRELVTALGRADETIVAGPWLTETGFELLYWIPFLTWARAYGNLAPDRLIVVSRGGGGVVVPTSRRGATRTSSPTTRPRNSGGATRSACAPTAAG